MNGIKPLIVFAAFLWVAVLVTYTAQAKNQPREGNASRLVKLQQSTSCSSSSSSGGPK